MEKSIEHEKPVIAGARTDDAIAVLKNHHATVRTLFARYESGKDAADADEKMALVTAICAALTAHATAEEELFYPALRGVIDGKDLLDEAQFEHASARELIAQVLGTRADHPLFDARMKLLSESVEHHVNEEEGELFPKVRASGLDLVALGAKIALRQEALLAEILEDV